MKVFNEGTGTACVGGMTLREGIFLLEEVHRSGTMSSMDIVEINPSIGSESDVKTTLNSAKAVILAALGNNRGGNSY